METYQIRNNIETAIEQWRNLQSRRNQYVTFSPRAADFLVEMIENIQLDPSDNWRTNEINYNAAQEFAISVIPNALNQLLELGRYRRPMRTELRITSWEIWHSLTPMLNSWCFIPKDV